MNKPFSPSCARNSEPILAALRGLLSEAASVLEIGSGTGQHAVHFSQALPSITWQSSDRAACLPGIRLWLEEARSTPAGRSAASLPDPIELDVAATPWPDALGLYDAVFSANTCHIMAWTEVESLFAGVSTHLKADGRLLIYGPFNKGGEYTSESNALFDAWLLTQGPQQGIRDLEALYVLGQEHGLLLEDDLPMPANNQLLVFRRQR